MSPQINIYGILAWQIMLLSPIPIIYLSCKRDVKFCIIRFENTHSTHGQRLAEFQNSSHDTCEI